SHTPVRNIVAPRTLEDIIQIYAKKLSLSIDKSVDAYEQLEALRSQLLDTDAVISVADIPDDIKEQLTRSLWPRLAGVGGAGTAAGSRWAARKVLELTNSKWLDLIKLIPKVGPGLIAVRTIASTVATISAPIGVALSLWTLNENFGPQWDRCLTLLVGSALCLQSQNSDSKKFPKSPTV
ncbi:MAG: hypothetical protein VX278_13210, partial [Myxococcota bacterium]|nr:hypothetical protein [Myxococcota bacterium]